MSTTNAVVEGTTPPHKNSLSLVDPSALVNAMQSNDQSTTQQEPVTEELVAGTTPQPEVDSAEQQQTAAASEEQQPVTSNTETVPASSAAPASTEPPPKPKRKRIRPSRAKARLNQQQQAGSQQSGSSQQMMVMQSQQQLQTVVLIQTPQGPQPIVVNDPNCLAQLQQQGALVRHRVPIVQSQSGVVQPMQVINTPTAPQQMRVPVPAVTVRGDTTPEATIWNKKRHYLKKAVRALVFKNAALCDEVARLHQRVATTVEERKIILKRLMHHERLRQRRETNAIRRQEARAQQAAAQATAGMVSTMQQSPLRVNVPVQMSYNAMAPVSLPASSTSNTATTPNNTFSTQLMTPPAPHLSTSIAQHAPVTTITMSTTAPSNDAITADMIEHGDLNQILEAD